MICLNKWTVFIGLFLIVYLWMMTGLGWGSSYEAHHKVKFGLKGWILVLLTCPVLAGIAAAGDALENIRTEYQHWKKK